MYLPWIASKDVEYLINFFVYILKKIWYPFYWFDKCMIV